MKRHLPDTSAWHRATNPAIAPVWGRLLHENLIATCAPVRLEVLYSARTIASYEQVAMEMRALHQLPCGDEQFERALEVQSALARLGGLHHRSVTIADLIIAASAEAGGAVVWHYDEDFDRIAEITGQPTQWIAPRGTL